MKGYILFLKKQKTQIQDGGWPVVKSKIRTIKVRINNYIPVSLVSLLCYFAKTLIGRHRAVYLRRFGAELSDLIRQSTTYQSNKTNIFLMEAEKSIAASNVDGTLALCQKAAVIDSRVPEIYFQMANAFFLQGKFDFAMSSYETGVKLLQEESVEQGLNLFGVKIINEKGWGFNIGHIGFLDALVKLRMLGLLSSEKRVVLVRSGCVANLCYLNYWKRYLDIVFLDNRKYRFLESLCSPITEHVTMLQLKEGFVNMVSAYNRAENLWHSENRPPLLELNEVDRERGYEILEQWSIPSQSWFVCLHVREGDPRITRSGPNSDIITYVPAIKAITSRGGWVIRMGHPGMKKLPPLPRVIDYANTAFKSDWMDVFLWASCQFFIGTSSGPTAIPPTFGKPVLLTNACTIGINVNWPNSLMLPKLFWSREKNRFFTFKEMLDGLTGWTISRIFDGIDYDLIDNTPEEIESAVIEMLDKHENAPETYNDLSVLQKKLNSLQMKYGDTGLLTISETFAQRHSDLF